MTEEPVVVISTLPGHADDEPFRVEGAAGAWTTLWTAQAGAVIDAVSGLEGVESLHVTVDDRLVDGSDPDERRAARLAVVACRVPPLPALRVVDVIQLGAAAPIPLWQTLMGTARARRGASDVEAAARALAGRIGLGRWLDVEARQLPPAVAALTDTARGIIGSPRALVWRRPEWLAVGDTEAIVEVIEDEQDRMGFAVIEVRERGDTRLRVPPRQQPRDAGDGGAGEDVQ